MKPFSAAYAIHFIRNSSKCPSTLKLVRKQTEKLIKLKKQTILAKKWLKNILKLSNMPKITEEQLLDLTDFLNALGPTNSRSLNEIAIRLKISKRKARNFLSALTPDGPARFRAAINYSRLPIVTALVFLKAETPAMAVALTNELSQCKFVDRVVELNYSAASHLLIMRVPTSEFAEQETVQPIADQFRGKISWTNTLFSSNSYYQDGLKDAPEGAKKIDLDETDWLVLNALYKNANRTLEELAKEVNLKKPSLHRRMELLKENGIIRGYFCEANYANQSPEKKPLFVIFAIRANAEDEAKIRGRLGINYGDKIEFFYRVYGEYDLLVCMRFKELEEYRKFISNELNASESIKVRSFVQVAEKRREWIYDHAMHLQTLAKPKKTR